jgi:PAS domain S-box-containing protein
MEDKMRKDDLVHANEADREALNAGPALATTLQSAFQRLKLVDQTFDQQETSPVASALEHFVLPLTNLLLVPSSLIQQAMTAALPAIAQAGALDRIILLRRDPEGLLVPNLFWPPEPGTSPACTDMTIAFNGSDIFDKLERVSVVQNIQMLEGACPLKTYLAELEVQSALFVKFQGDQENSGIAIFASRQEKSLSDPQILIFEVITSVLASLLLRHDTDRKYDLSRRELENERDKLEATLTALPDLVLELDHKGRLRSFHSQRMAAYVRAPDQYIGKSASETLPERVAKVIDQAIKDVDQTGVCEGLDFGLRLEDGRHWFSVTASKRKRDADNPQHGYLLVVRDITSEHRKIQEIMKLSRIVQRTSNMVILTNAKREIEWVNEAFEVQTGYTLEEIAGKQPGSVLQGSGTDTDTIKFIHSELALGRGVRTEILNYDKSGTPYWVEMDIQPVKDEAQRITGYVAIQSDVTERHQHVSELKRAEETARENQAAAMDASRDGIAITDADGNFVYMNRAHLDMFAIAESEDILGKNWSTLYDPDKAEIINQQAFPKLLDTGGWKGEIAGRRHDGTAIQQEVSLTLKQDGGIVCITRDIGDRLRAQAERSRLRDEIQIAQRREIMGQMAAGLAHDFNNLIASISGSASLLLNTEDLDQHAHAERILLATNKATDMVQRLLDIGARKPNKTEINLRNALHEARDLVLSGNPSNIAISISEALPDLKLQADSTDFLQVILNLILNSRDALQASDAEEPEIRIDVETTCGAEINYPPLIGEIIPDTDYVSIWVRDNGPGMNERSQRQAFEPYFTTKGAKGSGIGLAVVATIVQANDGAIIVKSEENEGCEVNILWPLTSRHMAMPKETLPNAKPTGRLDGKSILLVDDSEELLRVLSIFLERAGAEVCVSTNPFDILESIKADPDAWDLLITDFDMPGMNGAELARAVKIIDPQIPIVLITALADWRGRTCLNSGRDFLAVLGKPLESIELVSTAEIAIRSSPR